MRRIISFLSLILIAVITGLICFSFRYQKSFFGSESKKLQRKGQYLALKEDLSLGENRENEQYVFTRIIIDVDDDGRLYVLDEKFRNIRVFDRYGKFIQHIGKIGQGPGEYQYPVTLIQVTKKKELVVYDRGTRKFIFYSLDGEHLKEVKARQLGIPFKISIDSKGRFICFCSSAPPSLELKRFDSNFEVLETFFSRPEEIGSGNDLKVAQPTVHFALTQDDKVVWGYSDKCEIKVQDEKGQLIRKIIWSQKPVKFSKKDKKAYGKIYEGMIARGARLIFPTHFPAFADISIDDRNRVFVKTYQKNKDGNNYFDIFDLEGNYLTRVALPFSPSIWKNNKAYAVFRDEEGYQIIKRYTLRRN